YRLGIGIEEKLGRVEAMTPLRVVGAINAIAIQLPRSDVREIPMPDQIRTFHQWDALTRHGILRMIEEAKLDGGSVLGEDREVGPLAIPGRTEGSRSARPDPNHSAPVRRTRALDAATLAVSRSSPDPPSPPYATASVASTSRQSPTPSGTVTDSSKKLK